MKKFVKGQIAHGDLLLIPTTHKPKGTKRAPVNGRHILAHGEVTGHHHSVSAKCATLIDEGEVTYLTVNQLTGVMHHEHSVAPLEAITYEVRKQYETTDDDESWVSVRD